MTDAAPTLPLALDGYTPLPPGKLATIVTYLEMTSRPAPLREHGSEGFELRRLSKADPGRYRALFRRIGEDWLWVSRLRLSDGALRGILEDPAYELYVLGRDGETDLGLLELDFRQAGEAELGFLGVVPDLVGSGAGRFMINRANEMVWARPVTRFHVHTCTFDHPAAVGFYRKAGFTPQRLAIEVMDDPRLQGLLPRSAAPQIPLIDI